ARGTGLRTGWPLMRTLIRGADPVPAHAVHRGMRPVMAILGGYKTLASSALAPALGRPRPVRRAGTDLDVTIEAIDPVADDVVSLTLVGSYGGPLPGWRPGAHLAVFLPSGRQRQ